MVYFCKKFVKIFVRGICNMTLLTTDTICFIAYDGGPSDHFSTFTEDLVRNGHKVQIYASGPALEKFQDQNIENVIPFSLEDVSEEQMAINLAKQCAKAAVVITDVGHVFDINLQRVLASQAPKTLRLAYYDNPESYVPGGDSSVAAKVMLLAHGVANLAKTTIYKDYIPSTLQYVDGDILVVNDLWNSVKGTNPKIITLDSIGAQVLQFVVKSTQLFDESHNWKHAIQVAHNALDIIDSKEVLYLALLHDVCDHKYSSESIQREELSQFIARNIPEFGHINSLIDHVSFSSQKTMDKVHPVLEAVRDSDRLEAIGEIGLIRCIQVTESRGGKYPEDVIDHCFDKLLRLVPEGYIANRTTEAIRRHNVIVDFVKQNGYNAERLND